MLHRSLPTICFVLACGVNVLAGAKDMAFIAVDSTYEVACTIETQLGREELLDVIHDWQHVQGYMTQANLAIELLADTDSCTGSNGTTCNVIRYTYRYLVFTKELTFLRTRYCDSGLVVFTLTHKAENSSLIPSVVETGGRYRVTEDEVGRRIIYHQQTRMDRPLIWIHRQVIRHETMVFLKNFEKYLANYHSTQP